MAEDNQAQSTPYELAGGLAHGQTGMVANPPASHLRIPYYTEERGIANGTLILEYVRVGVKFDGRIVYEFKRIDGSI